ncbi:PucR family transcriptional regulator [Mycobacterium hackensackense]|uniref:PucR family transcriptional regulator n=1 Tax=Mycobacterium hackensackense TaxID=228909 RepID=UPI002265F691|nr:helix-turn-helix domain-containing protein [Mycobacterium hackensackense]
MGRDDRVVWAPLPEAVSAAMRSVLPVVAERTVAAVVSDVPSYADAFSGRTGQNIERAVQQSLAAFLQLVSKGDDPDTSPSIQPALDGAFALGQGEARQNRSTDVLLAAFRSGARTAWREWSAVAVAHEVPGDQLAVFAEKVFAYIDRLSAASVAGHAHELAKSGLARQRHRETLARQLLRGAPLEDLLACAERAEWRAPATLTAVAVPRGSERRVAGVLAAASLEVPEDALPALTRPVTVLLCTDGSALRRQLDIPGVVIGPDRPWARVAQSVARVLRAVDLCAEDADPFDTEENLKVLVLQADPDALADLRAAVLTPLDSQRPAVRDKLVETLRAWLLHQGRRDDVAAALFVHPQTVRYRLGQLRELYGETLTDPDVVEQLVIALAGDTARARRPIANLRT